MGDAEGEVVFSTGMSGYPQSLTDPSFAGQILIFTYPLIGNYGVPTYKAVAPHLSANFESERIWAKGVVVGQHCTRPSHYESVRTFSDWLASEKIPGISGIDTRMLTQKIRDTGVMPGFISSKPRHSFSPTPADYTSVSFSSKIVYKPKKANGKHVALIDCGVKHAIIRELLALGYQVTRIPHDSDPTKLTGIDGVACSNGPGDPKDWGKTIVNIRRVVDCDIPFLGICLGHQLLALAIGADTYKLKYGHRGLNQPCLDLSTNKAYVTSQNHGYAVDPKTLPKEYSEWFINLNDRTNEGIRHQSKKIVSIQFHPEGNPGPFDAKGIFSII